MEDTLSNIHGVLDVKAKLRNAKLGEARILYDPTGVTLEDLKQAIPKASGEKHIFRVITAIEEDREK